MSDNSAKPKPFFAGSAIDDRRYVYVERAADERLFRMLSEGLHCNLHAGRQSGKTSLMRKTRRRLETQGHFCLEVNLSLFFTRGSFSESLLLVVEKILEDGKKALPELSRRLPARKMESPASYWIRLLKRLGSLLSGGKRLYLLLDEVDSMTVHKQGELAELFLRMREFFQSDTPASRGVVLLLVSVLTPMEMFMDYNTGGATAAYWQNVPLELLPNTPEVRLQMAQQAFPGSPFQEVDDLLFRLLNLTGGQPFLTAQLGMELQREEDPSGYWPLLEKEVLVEPRRLVGNHLQGMDKQLTDMGSRIFSLTQLYVRIHKGEETVFARDGLSAAGSLENIGLVRRNADGSLRVANPLYQAHLTPEWAEAVVKQYEQRASAKAAPLHAPSLPRRIALIHVGGTMGMVTDGGRSSFEGALNLIDSFIQEELNRLALVESIAKWSLDGINVTPKEWVEIAKWIDEHRKEFDGFVIAHGTDTLAYSASAVAFMLGRGLDRPVVFTGAQTTIDQLHGDTRQNFYRSVYAAANDKAIPEVQICFGDRVMRAVRAEKRDDRTYDGFDSPGWPHLARITENYLVNEFAMDRTKGPNTPYLFRPYIADRLLLITLAPGVRPDPYREILHLSHDRGEPLDGILITTPGLGNIPNRDPFNFRNLIGDAVSLGTPVLIASQVPINPYTQNQYEMASVPAQYGAIPAGNLTLAAAFTKFAWVVGCVNRECRPPDRMEEIKRRMRTIFVGEEGEYGEQLDRANRQSSLFPVILAGDTHVH
ncbi:MAG: asparaginase [Magnetococcales bacterium]|nr:asparaginase [Magnetococcales bacterium]